jgi:hypothetical protein
MSGRRVGAIFRKELREYRRHTSIVVSVAIFPLIFLIQPLAIILVVPTASAVELAQDHLLLYMLAIPVLAPAMLAAYAVAGERQQGTLEPVLTTPVRREEFLLGKALAVLVPSVLIAYAVYAVFLVLVALLAEPAVVSGLFQPSDILVHLGWHRDLDPIERRARGPAAQPGREPAARGGDIAHRVRRHPRVARPCGRSLRRPDPRRRPRLAHRVPDVQPRAAHYRYQVMRSTARPLTFTTPFMHMSALSRWCQCDGTT